MLCVAEGRLFELGTKKIAVGKRNSLMYAVGIPICSELQDDGICQSSCPSALAEAFRVRNGMCFIIGMRARHMSEIFGTVGVGAAAFSRGDVGAGGGVASGIGRGVVTSLRGG